MRDSLGSVPKCPTTPAKTWIVPRMTWPMSFATGSSLRSQVIGPRHGDLFLPSLNDVALDSRSGSTGKLLTTGLSGAVKLTLPNQRMKLPRWGGHPWWTAQWRLSFLIVATPSRDSLGCIRRTHL